MQLIKADWPAPVNVQAFTTVRIGSESQGNYVGNNLALHVGDDPAAVSRNRSNLQDALKLKHNPLWLNQTHSSRVVYVGNGPDPDFLPSHLSFVDENSLQNSETTLTADASITNRRNLPLAIMTADCLPIVVCNREGTEIAAIHAGWRGLVDGIIENTIHAMKSPVDTLMAWIGPGICRHCFEIGPDLVPRFQQHPEYSPDLLTVVSDSFFMDLAGLAKNILQKLDLNLIKASDYCTFEQHELFYSYRRQGKTGRMATLIWFT